jgi:hypothetical protein
MSTILNFGFGGFGGGCSLGVPLLWSYRLVSHVLSLVSYRDSKCPPFTTTIQESYDVNI